jgi:hypothetical protein
MTREQINTVFERINEKFGPACLERQIAEFPVDWDGQLRELYAAARTVEAVEAETPQTRWID